MGILDEIRGLRSQGFDNNQIRQSLRGRGFTTDQINDALSNATIKQAVSYDQDEDNAQDQRNNQQKDFNIPSPSQEYNSEGYGSQGNNQYAQSPSAPSMTQEMSGGNSDMVPSMMNIPSRQDQQNFSQQAQQNQDYDDGYGSSESQDPYYSQSYDNNQGYQAGISAETISEIADQAVGEKINQIREKLESVGKFKTGAETKLEVLDQRLKRLESIIDRLQLSILQKVGDSMTKIDDIKRELVETQKSFIASKKSHSGEHHAPAHHTAQSKKSNKHKK